MDMLFEVHMLNETGKQSAQKIAEAFDQCLTVLTAEVGREGASGRCFSIAKAKLEESCFFAKKAMALRPENQA